MDTVRYGLCSITVPLNQTTFELPADAVIVRAESPTGVGLQIIYALPGVPEYWPWESAAARAIDMGS